MESERKFLDSRGKELFTGFYYNLGSLMFKRYEDERALFENVKNCHSDRLISLTSKEVAKLSPAKEQF